LRSSARACTRALPIACVAALAAALLGPSSVVPAAGAVVGNCVVSTSWGTPRADLASQVVQLVNQHRAARGLVALGGSASLTNAAVWKARHMAAYGYMTHNDPAPPIARTTQQRFEACGYPVFTAGWGENIAYGYATPAAVMQGWLSSPGHRANIENPGFRTLGVGAAASASGRLYWAQAFGTTAGGTVPPPPPPPPPPAGSAPTVSITSGPAATTTSTSASFSFATTGTVSSRTCQLDSGAAVACTSPRSYTGLAQGTHTFRVTVSNAYGSRSAAWTWTIGSTAGTAPALTFTSRPSSWTTATSATFAWTTTGAVTSTTCSLDYGPALPCSSPRTYSGLARYTTHRLSVTVANSYGSRTAIATWTVF
jgi:uncharacterized protein YkwD